MLELNVRSSNLEPNFPTKRSDQTFQPNARTLPTAHTVNIVSVLAFESKIIKTLIQKQSMFCQNRSNLELFPAVSVLIRSDRLAGLSEDQRRLSEDQLIDSQR